MLGLLLAMAAASDPTAPAAVDPAAPAAITFAAGACFGNCPVYSARVSADGDGLFGSPTAPPRHFTITPEQFRAFAAHVAPLASITTCGGFMADHPRIDIIWIAADGNRTERRYFQHCLDRYHPALAPLLREAPGLLPIGDFIGRR